MLPLEVPAFSTKTKDSSDSQTCLVFRNKPQNLLGDLNHLAEAIFFSEFLDVLLLEYVLTELNRIFFSFFLLPDFWICLSTQKLSWIRMQLMW